MKFRVVVVSQEVFDQWVAAHKKIPAAPVAAAYTGTPPGVIDNVKYVPEMPKLPDGTYTGVGTGGNGENGLKVFNGNKGLCYTCHAIAGNEKAIGKVGPNLTYLGSRTTLAAGLIPNTTADLYAWLHAPGIIKPGNKMAAVIKAEYAQ